MSNFQIYKITDTTYCVKDDARGIVCTFEIHQYNETQKFSLEPRAHELSAEEAATAVREMGEWLWANHYNIIFPVNQRRRIGDEMRALRAELGLTQKEVAEKIGITQGNFARIELGKYSVGFDTLQEIAEALGCDVSFVKKE